MTQQTCAVKVLLALRCYILSWFQATNQSSWRCCPWAKVTVELDVWSNIWFSPTTVTSKTHQRSCKLLNTGTKVSTMMPRSASNCRKYSLMAYYTDTAVCNPSMCKPCFTHVSWFRPQLRPLHKLLQKVLSSGVQHGKQGPGFQGSLGVSSHTWCLDLKHVMTCRCLILLEADV